MSYKYFRVKFSNECGVIQNVMQYQCMSSYFYIIPYALCHQDGGVKQPMVSLRSYDNIHIIKFTEVQ